MNRPHTIDPTHAVVAPSARPAGGRSARLRWWQSPAVAHPTAAVLLLVGATVGVFAAGVDSPFVFDGRPLIDLLEKYPHWDWESVWKVGRSRPVGYLTFQWNYAAVGLQVFWYHVTNIGIHLAAALLLLELVRRTLRMPTASGYGADAALAIALGSSLLWSLHPLQTQSVTNLCQRFESQMGLLFLASIYAFMRATGSATIAGRRRWYLVSICCCLLGVATKEVAAMAPLAILWYDRVFVAGSFREVYLRRRWYYAGCLLSWPLLIWLMATHAGEYQRSGLVVVDQVTPWGYALTQPAVVWHYLRLSFWPTGLCLDYGWPVAAGAAEIVPPLVSLLGLLVVLGWVGWRSPPWGFPAGVFFLILAPTSSIVPIRDLMFEHRMYLPLAPLAVAVCVVAWQAARWLADRIGNPRVGTLAFGLFIAASAIALAIQTHRRIGDYATEVRIWTDTVNKAPHHTRAHYNLGVALQEAGFHAKAIACYERAIELKPDYRDARVNLGVVLGIVGQYQRAIDETRRALDLNPENATALVNLGNIYNAQQKHDQAAAHYRRAVQIEPAHATAHHNLGNALVSQGKFTEAILAYQQALKCNPKMQQAVNALDRAQRHLAQMRQGEFTGGDEAPGRSLALSLLAERRFAEALPHLQALHEQHPHEVQWAIELSRALEPLGRIDEAVAVCQSALEFAAEPADVHSHMGGILARSGQRDQAVRQLEFALQLRPEHADAHNNLGVLMARSNQLAKAVEHYQRALRSDPEFAKAHHNLAIALVKLGRPDDAVPHLEAVLQLLPDHPEARRLLAVLREDMENR